MKSLRTLISGLFLSMVCLMTASVAQAQDFVNGHEDLPLLEGLKQDPASTLVFDTPQGRVVETYAQTEATAKTVLDAYDNALPQMGWKADGNNRFVRKGETLTFEVISYNKPTVMRILLTSN